MNSDNEFGRYGTSAVSFEEKVVQGSDVLHKVIYYYGGGKMFNKHTSIRECINQVIRFVPLTGEFKTLKQSGAINIPRRYHSACSFGKYMICHGGVDDQGRVLSDVICYDMQHHRWEEVQTVKQTLNKYLNKTVQKFKLPKHNNGPGELYFHKFTPVFYQQRYRFWKEFLYE